ncbi:trigger factor [Kineosphaera limosa]|nr:trigger factor [Kineosphaera limosa]
MTVEVPSEELKPSVDAALKAIGSQINVPGFRRGKVPSRIIEQRVGRGAVLQEAVNQALPDFYGQALIENELKPLSQPEVDITEVPVNDTDQLVFTAELDVRPPIELPDFAGISVQVDAVDESDVAEFAAEQLEELRQRVGSLVGVERAAADGDFVTIDLRGTIDDEEIDAVEGVSYEIGSASMIEGLDDALTGLSAGESKTFTAALAGGDRVGEDAQITVTLTAVKERELPELDDDFAQEVSEFETLDELREAVLERSRQAKGFEQGLQARDKVLEQLLETLSIPVPESLVEAEVHQHLAGEDRLEDEEHRGEVDSEARKALQTQLLLDAIVEAEEVQVTQQELIEYLVNAAQQYGMDPATFAKAMDDGDQVAGMAGEVARRKALASVLERVQVTDAEGNVVDLNAITDGEEDEDLEGVDFEAEDFEEDFEDDEDEGEVDEARVQEIVDAIGEAKAQEDADNNEDADNK